MFANRKSVAPENTKEPESEKSSKDDDQAEQNDKESMWAVLIKHWRARSFLEIVPGHSHYELAQGICAGIQDFMKNQARVDPDIILHEDDFSMHITRKVSINGHKPYTFCTYAPAVFATLRRAIGIREKDYYDIIADLTLPYYQYLSNSLGRNTFFVTHDRAFFIKTERKHSFGVFKNMLKEYLIHFLRYPHSLLVKVVGLYSIKRPGHKEVYFCVMQSIFYPDDRLEARYDVKGCLAGRHTDPKKAELDRMVTLKDQNFLEEDFDLGDNRPWFLRQMELDVKFLCRQGTMDYSLLVGKQPLIPSDKNQDAGDMIVRAARSLQPTENNSKNRQNKVLQEAVKKDMEKNKSNLQSKDIKQIHVSHGNIPLKAVCSADDLLTMLSSSGGSNCTTSDNRRLLVNTRNCLHQIDGQENRYFVGIIDFFSKYTLKKKLDAIWKSIKFCGKGHSTVNPERYSERMMEFLRNHTS